MSLFRPRRFVDSHVHFFDVVDDHGLRWSWLEEDSGVGHVPATAAVAARRFTPPELWAEGRRIAALEQCIHVQAATGTDDGLLETRWLAQLRDRHGAPHAAVAFVALDKPDALRQIDGQREHSWVRGVRDPGKTALLEDERYAERVAHLGRTGMLLEVMCTWRRFAALASLARRCPETTIVLEHLGLAPCPRSAAFPRWREEVSRLADVPNVWIKISGLGLGSPNWQVGDVQVLVDAALEVFGVARCLAGSNWPIERAASSYPDVVLAIAGACRELSATESDALLAANAVSLYGLGPPAGMT